MAGNVNSIRAAQAFVARRGTGGLIADLEELLGRSVDVVTAEELRPHVRDRVLADAVAL